MVDQRCISLNRQASRSTLVRRERFDPDPAHTARSHLEDIRSRFRKVENRPAPRLGVGAAIIDPDNDRPTALKIRYANDGAERQRPMRSGQSMHVEIFATRGFVPSMATAIPRRDPILNEHRPLKGHLLRALTTMGHADEYEESNELSDHWRNDRVVSHCWPRSRARVRRAI